MPRMLSAAMLGVCSCVNLICGFSLVQAQLPDISARQLGLETAWKVQVQLPIAQSPIVSTLLWPSAEEARQYAQTEVPGRSIRVYADVLGPDGEPIGIERAKQEAKTLAARILGKFDGIEPKVVSVPRIYLVVVTVDGAVQNFDAETGEILWRAEAGFASAPTAPASVGTLGVALTHGSYLRLHDWKSGAIVKTHRLSTATSAGVAMTSTLAFVPSLAGVVAVYSVGEESMRPWQFTVHGLPVGSPVGNSSATPPLAAIVTNKGHLYVFADEGKPSAWFRFETQSPFTGSLAAAGNSFYAGDFIGSLFKVSGTRLGQLEWRFTTGSPVIQNPLPISDRVYSLSENGRLFAINDDDGLAVWSEPIREIESVASAGKDSLYAQTSTRGLAEIDLVSGKVIGQAGTGYVNAVVANHVNDRIYVIGRAGQLQCLREIGAELPTMHVQAAPAGKPKPKVPMGAESQLEGTAMAGSAESSATSGFDPFALGTDSPTSGTDAAANALSPFNDPFAAPKPADASTGPAPSDPFGSPEASPAGTNPFGTP